MSGYQKAKIVTTTSIKTTTDPQSRKTTGKAKTNVTQMNSCGPGPSSMRPPPQQRSQQGGTCPPVCTKYNQGGSPPQPMDQPPRPQPAYQRPALPQQQYASPPPQQRPAAPPQQQQQRSAALQQQQRPAAPSNACIPTCPGTNKNQQGPQRQPPAQPKPPCPSRSGPPQPPPPKQIPKKCKLEDELEEGLNQLAAEQPGEKVLTKGKRLAIVCPEKIDTPAGKEVVLQKATLEQRLERDEKGERMVKTLKLADFDKAKGKMSQVEIGIRQLDPHYKRTDGGKDVVGVTSTVSITQSYKTLSTEAVRVSTEPAEPEIDMSPEEVAQMVAEEKEDVENTLKMVPPDLVLVPGKYQMKQRLQKLRLNSESMALLEQAIIYPSPTADEAQAEPTPDMMSAMMHTVEIGMSPQTAPDQVFNSLFHETPNEQFIKLSSVSPGPMQDMVVPSDMPKDIHKEVLSADMGQLAERLANVANPDQLPQADLFDKNTDDAKKSPEKGKNKQKSFQIITDDKSPWANAELEPLVNIVGGVPVEVIDPLNTEEMELDAVEKEMANGVEYFIDANPLQYMSRVQLRGSQLPSFFPGYMIALPEFPDILKIARNPDEVFSSAWRSVQPKYFPEDNMFPLLV